MSERERDAAIQSKLQTLMSYAPLHYERSELYRQLMSAHAVESVAMRRMLEDVFAQFFVETATWGLAFWEEEFGLITNETLSYQMRRALVLQKMRGTGTMTSETMAAILSSYGARTAEIDQQFESYKFGAVLVDFILSPKRPVDDVHVSIRETIKTVRPAHLDFWIEYREHVAESFRAWYKAQTGQEYAHSDQLQEWLLTAKNTELKFGQNESSLFRLNSSALGVDPFARSELKDISATVLERLQEQEYFDLYQSADTAFRLNVSEVNGINRTLQAPEAAEWELIRKQSEKAPAVTERYLGMTSDVRNWELPYRVLPESAVLNASLLGAPLSADRLAEEAAWDQTMRVSEQHLLQVPELSAATEVGTQRAEEQAKTTESCLCVLYQSDTNGMETVLEQRAL